jgi:peptidoglycan hydrolase CwlO-like protein
MLVARRLAELREKNQKKVEVETSEKETQSYLQDLLDQIEAINREKQPHRMLFFKTDNISALQKIKALNERLKPLLELLF